MRRAYIAATVVGLLCALVALAVSIRVPNTLSEKPSSEDVEAILSATQQIVDDANRRDLAGVARGLWSEAAEAALYRKMLRKPVAESTRYRSCKDWGRLSLSSQPDGTFAVLVVPGSGLVHDNLLVTTIDEAYSGGQLVPKLSNRLVLVPIHSGDEAYYLPLIEEEPHVWRVMSSPPGFPQRSLPGVAELREIRTKR